MSHALRPAQDLRQLRKLAAVRGLVNSELRARHWVTLSGADPSAVTHDDYLDASRGTHRDSGVVDVDVARSLWGLMPGAGDEERAGRREALARLLTAVVVHHGGDGLHDVASVLLLVAGERAAFAILCRLTTGALRDATRPTLDPVLELLGLMEPVMQAADPELAELARDLSLPPYYALSWFITWFSHDVAGLDVAARLFDLFLALHPLMPLYVGAAAMASQRAALLAAGRGEGGMPELHSALTNLDITRALGVDDLACRQQQQQLQQLGHQGASGGAAIELYRRLSPEQIVARRTLRLEMSVAPRAFKDRDSGVWRVPEPSRATVFRAFGGSSGGGGGGSGSGKTPQWNLQLQQALGKLLPGGARQAPPAVMLLHLGLYTVMAAGLWVVMRLQHEGGPSALPWG
ncbi:TBC1 domain family member 20 [Monoraphidium neglectum]|uniref:TBC1 domain family member 20 n=1 Tax=Monoraphidium neglectum TaxID=145388 RepID=A0A0D2N2E8_9CHLO|nr:TBC1 domain family member 20 [Monoraphidium neglectum]KIZ00376.1 TBC1 domain family member 20 [Monoraphidium neglectum]|eukprot:XP_013899395.1 TBC1 domain family member 20 [Monoraphidium neglectum]